MACLTRKFTFNDSHDSGIDGWFPDGMDGNEEFLPGGGVLVAHDLLEHFKCDGSTEDEMMASGSVIYIRHETGRISRKGLGNHSQDVAMGHDMYSAWLDSGYGGIKSIRRPRNGFDVFDAGQEANMLKAFMSNVRDDDVSSEVEDYDKHAREWFADAANWVRRGYLKAQKRWEGRGSLAVSYPAYCAADLFWEIADAVDALTRYDGEHIAIHVNIRRHSFNIVQTH